MQERKEEEKIAMKQVLKEVSETLGNENCKWNFNRLTIHIKL